MLTNLKCGKIENRYNNEILLCKLKYITYYNMTVM